MSNHDKLIDSDEIKITVPMWVLGIINQHNLAVHSQLGAEFILPKWCIERIEQQYPSAKNLFDRKTIIRHIR